MLTPFSYHLIFCLFLSCTLSRTKTQSHTHTQIHIYIQSCPHISYLTTTHMHIIPKQPPASLTVHCTTSAPKDRQISCTVSVFPLGRHRCGFYCPRPPYISLLISRTIKKQGLPFLAHVKAACKLGANWPLWFLRFMGC